MDATFLASEGEPDGVSAEQAVDAVRYAGFAVDRPPERVQFGTATCRRQAACLGIGPETYTSAQAWLIEWSPRAGGASATFVVDAVTGEILAGFGGE